MILGADIQIPAELSSVLDGQNLSGGLVTICSAPKLLAEVISMRTLNRTLGGYLDDRFSTSTVVDAQAIAELWVRLQQNRFSRSGRHRLIGRRTSYSKIDAHSPSKIIFGIPYGFAICLDPEQRAD